MNPFEYAKRMELQGKLIYEEELSKTTNPGLKSILKMLISQEQRHYELFEYMEKSTDIEISKASFKGVKTIFEKMKSAGLSFPKEEVELYRKILKIEQDSEKVYREMASEQKNDDVKALISQIADEEHSHYIIIHNIIELLMHPKSWVEDAEFNHLEDY